MKILSLKNAVRNLGIAAVTAGAVLAAPVIHSQTTKQDSFERTTVSVSGTNSPAVLLNAPSPNVKIMGKMKTAAIVVDLKNNVLYTYDKKGEAKEAFLVASGKKSTPTTPGVRLVTHVETYPYKTAPRSSKRRKDPNSYGPKIICLDMLNTKTGETWCNGEFIHGNKDKSSLGKYASHGCIRMDNDVIKVLASQVKRGDVVIIK